MVLKKLNWNFLEGGGRDGGAKQKTFPRGSMDIFWNCPLEKNLLSSFLLRKDCSFNVMSQVQKTKIVIRDQNLRCKQIRISLHR